MKSATLKKQSQKGFTLIEIIIVVVVIGILMAVFLPSIRDAVNPSKAVAYQRAADQISTTLTLIAKQCGVSTTIASNPLPATGQTLSDVIFAGSASVASAYTSCYGQSQAKALTEVGQPSGTAGIYNVQGSAVSLAGGGAAPLQVTFAAVPDEMVLGVAQKYNPSLTALAASDSTGAVVRYGTATGGARSLTIVKQ